MKFLAVNRSYLLIECLLALFVASWVSSASAQGTVYRCKGNEYVASVKDSKNGDCKILEGGNVTIVQGTRAASADPQRVASVTPKASSTGSSSQKSESRPDSSEQKARDSDARGILDSELKKSEAALADLLKEYNNGEPERNALEVKNPQRYVDRLADLKAKIARLTSDIESIKRELGRKS